MKAITLRQPWASLVAQGYKDIENRSWRTNFRGQVLIHAGKGMDKWGKDEIARFGIDLPWDPAELPRGGIIGVMTITDCVEKYPSRWFWGPYGFVITDVRPVEFYPCKGALSFWECNYPYVREEGIIEEIRPALKNKLSANGQ